MIRNSWFSFPDHLKLLTFTIKHELSCYVLICIDLFILFPFALLCFELKVDCLDYFMDFEYDDKSKDK